MSKSIESRPQKLLDQLIETGDYDEARDALNAQHAVQLNRVGKLIEASAFELAGLHPCDMIGQLITIAADLERIATAIQREAPFGNNLDI